MTHPHPASHPRELLMGVREVKKVKVTRGTVQGLISDLLGKRAPVLVVSLLLAMGALVGYSHSPNDQIVNGALLATTGFLIGGPSNMISSAISADLGRQEALQNSQQALATVTGIVDGTGSIGAAAGQLPGASDWG
ncbi:hypothetical protein PO909_029272 [Leuciscus waleckii]